MLFADVVQSMDIATAVGSERMRELMSELFDRCSEVVQRLGGTVNQFTGDGIMAVFGAPVSLEDHASRACLAALDIQRRAEDLAVEVHERDRVDLRLRVGLNSGEVIAGDVGSRAHSYTPVGDQVGMAQRMESVAPPGAVMLSESTARLVSAVAELGEPRQVQIKGVEAPVPARLLLSMRDQRASVASRLSTLVGREWEFTALTAMLDRAVNGHGCVACIVGPPGIGKSRIVAETVALAENRGAPVWSTWCESHTTDVPFLAANRLLRSALDIEGMDDEAARAKVRGQAPDADAADLILMFDELGIDDPADVVPDIAPEARRRRLTAAVNAAVLALPIPAVCVIEDAHWIDSTSESMLADFLSVIPRSRSLVLITFRPEYRGALSHTPGAQTIALAPLDDAQTVGLVNELLGTHPTVAALATQIAERASGNPFFAEELVRDLVGRGVLDGARGAYTCADEVADVDVPVTLQAAIAARIDRLDTNAKLTLNAAAVIGLRFDEPLLTALAHDASIKPLVRAELVDQVTFAPQAEYTFRHPLIQTVAYGSQLKSARAQLHRHLAVALQERDPQSMDENAALIAEHLEAASDLAGAFDWHMHAGRWLTSRDVNAARATWLRARQVADRLPADAPDREAMRIAPRALLCASAFRVGGAVDEDGFSELRRLAGAAEDKMSLALAMAGHVMSLVFHARYREASQLATELTALVDSFSDAGSVVALLSEVITAKLANGEVVDALRLAERAIDLTGGDPRMGDFVIESPLTVATVCRATARMCLGASGWKSDMDRATTMCREYHPLGQAVLLFWRYGYGVSSGAIRPDADAVQVTAEVLERAEQTGDNLSLEWGRFLHGFVLTQLDGSDRARGLALLAAAREAAVQHLSAEIIVHLSDIELAKEMARTGDPDEAIQLLGSVIERAISAGGMGSHGAAVEALVELLLRRGARRDVYAAQAAIERLAAVPTGPGFVVYETVLLRLRALLARACGNYVEYRQFANGYRARATEHGFERHIDTAAAMP